VGIAIFFWVYKDQNITEIEAALKEADYKWLILSVLLGLLSHFSRAVRWKILINSLGYKPRTINTFFAVLIMYLSNLALPRSGEIIRCGIVNKYEKVPFTKLLGTVFIERAVDMVMLFILLAIVLLTQFDKILLLLDNNPEMKENLYNITSSWGFVATSFAVFVVIILVIYLLRDKIRHTKIYIKITDLLKQFAEGLLSVINMERKFAFILHTFLIWGLYFLMIYICFWSFDFTTELGLMVGLTVFVMSSLGMVAPSPGGIGTWHFMAIQTLLIYGVTSVSDAGAFAFAVHGSTTFMLIISGTLAFIFLPIVNKNKPEPDVLKK